jgi:patatin-related protein
MMSPADASARPTFAPEQEVRLAVVMYGGVSLAIYIHGVAQELLSLVRATAPEAPYRAAVDSPEAGGSGRRALLAEGELRGAERVYRRLGQMLPLRRRADGDGRSPDPAPPAAGDPIRTRFVVDILSGTSAGGINGVFLAKALAANRPMTSLKRLWVSEGDLAKLINDAPSYADDVRGLARQEPPASLLNSRRMYCKLLAALREMDAGTGAGSASGDTPFVDELDLFVTATDIEGLPVRLPLADGSAEERRHKNVFHFRYARGDDGAAAADFGPEDDPFLAFAARCTSSFPFAFEPMRLDDIDEVLDLPLFRDAVPHLRRADHPGWRRFYPDYLQGDDDLDAEALAKRFRKVPFGDGGYLDNKPFTYAVSALKRRRPDFPVDRKLIYIEPAPERLVGSRREDPRKPDALDNVFAALFVLPRYETIREDLEQVRDFNRLIERVQVLLGGRDRDSEYWRRTAARREASAVGYGRQWQDQDLSDMLSRYGLAYGAYHRLKVTMVTDELAAMTARVAGFGVDRDERLAIRYLLGAWRGVTYELYHPPRADGDDAERQEPRPSENTFLFEFDLWWRLRRIAFLRERADEMVHLEPDALRARIESIPELSALKRRLANLDDGRLEELRRALLMIKWGLNGAHAELNRAVVRLGSPELPLSPFAQAVADLGLQRSDLWQVLAERSDAGRRKGAASLVAAGGLRAGLDRMAVVLRQTTSAVLTAAAHECQAILGVLAADEAVPEGAVATLVSRLETDCPRLGPVAQEILGYFFRYFEEYDMLSFPVLFETGVGEADPVEVIRVSPDDAGDLFDGRTRRLSPSERAAAGGEKRVAAGLGQSKLAGTVLANFGAFLAEHWRVSDMLWGRLDAAERLIAALLPDHWQLRGEMTEEAQTEILVEELGQAANLEAARVLAAATREAATNGSRAGLSQALADFAGEIRGPRLERLLAACLDRDRLAAFFIESSQANREPPPETTLRSAARATEVVGRMLESLSGARPALAPAKRPFRLLVWLGRLFWGLVEVSVPRSLPNLLGRHWLHLLYGFEAFALVLGTLLGREGVAEFGWTALGITAGLHLLTFLLNSQMRGKKRTQRTVTALAVTAVLALAGLGGVYVALHLGDDLRLWLRHLRGKPAAAAVAAPAGSPTAVSPPAQ